MSWMRSVSGLTSNRQCRLFNNKTKQRSVQTQVPPCHSSPMNPIVYQHHSVYPSSMYTTQVSQADTLPYRRRILPQSTVHSKTERPRQANPSPRILFWAINRPSRIPATQTDRWQLHRPGSKGGACECVKTNLAAGEGLVWKTCLGMGPKEQHSRPDWTRPQRAENQNKRLAVGQGCQLGMARYGSCHALDPEGKTKWCSFFLKS